MTQTRQQKLKLKKSKDRAKEIRRRHNIQQNAPDKRYRLDVKIDGQWRIGVKTWSSAYQVENHRIDTERRRAIGEEIAEGQVGDMVTHKIVLHIEASKPKGSAPDKILDGVKAVDPAERIKDLVPKEEEPLVVVSNEVVVEEEPTVKK